MNYQKHYDLLIERARQRSIEGYSERHHVIPKCLGGTDDIANLVALTPEGHYIAHLLLVKLNPTHIGLAWAAVKMTQGNKFAQRSNKLYGWLKRRHSNLSKLRVGDKNGAFGTSWIHNKFTLEATKIKKGEPIPEGWDLGRVPQNKCVACGTSCGKSKYCNTHASEARVNSCKRNAAMTSKKGLIYINNGVVQKSHDPSKQLPIGFVAGGLPRKRKQK